MNIELGPKDLQSPKPAKDVTLADFPNQTHQMLFERCANITFEYETGIKVLKVSPSEKLTVGFYPNPDYQPPTPKIYVAVVMATEDQYQRYLSKQEVPQLKFVQVPENASTATDYLNKFADEQVESFFRNLLK